MLGSSFFSRSIIPRRGMVPLISSGTALSHSSLTGTSSIFPSNRPLQSCNCGGRVCCSRCSGRVALLNSFQTTATHRRFYATSAGKETPNAASDEDKDGEATKKTGATTESGTDAALQEELKQTKSQLLYALADAENARRVAAEDVKKARDFSVKDFAKDMCDVMDALDRATQELNKLAKEDQVRLQSVVKGIELTRNILVHNLERHGVKKIKSDVGDVFDYNVHEALFNHTIKEGEKLEVGQIAAVVKTGYMIHQRVLRAAQVGVAQNGDM